MLSIEELSKSFTSNKGIVDLYDHFNLKIAKGSFVSIVGNNGTGKTTLLNLVAGIDYSDNGKILIDNSHTGNLNVGYIFQNYRQALYPWMNVIDNIAFSLKIKGIEKKERHNMVKRFCELHNLHINYQAYPYFLSGGQQQQITIIRSWINSPDLILMDEPFSSLDYHASFKFQKEIYQLWKETKTTIIFVSHRIDEAIFLSERVIILGDRPVKIIDDFKNPLSYPRDSSTLSTGEFGKIRNRILSQLENL